jgi:ectoine hydroxylase-related dioxygenase (phytanoyl-CoA dioxygenase family)
VNGAAALRELGVTPDVLTDDERSRLTRDGYIVLAGVVDSARVERVRERLSAVVGARRRDLATEVGLRRMAGMLLDYTEKNSTAGIVLQYPDALARTKQTAAALRTALAENDLDALREHVLQDASSEAFINDDLVGADPAFGLPLSTPRVLAAASHLIGQELHTWGLHCRAPNVGEGRQELHRDFEPRGLMCNSLWLLDDLDAENGATRVIPGSHLDDREPEHPDEPHPGEVTLEGNAGDVVVFSERLLHGGTKRRGGGPRRVLIGPYSVRSKFRDHPLHIRPEVSAEWSEAERWLVHLDDPLLSANERTYAATGAAAPGFS